MLFRSYGQELADIDSVSATGISIEWDSIPAAAITAIKIKPAGIPAPNAERYVCRGAFLEGVDNNSFPANAFGIISNWNDLPDAQREEVVGKIANILTAGATPPTTIQAVVTVQTIKSLPDGLTNIARTAYLKNGTPENVTLAAATAGIDKTTLSDGSVYYFDEITGEIKALVTILRETDTDGGIRLRVYNVKYLGY